MTARTDRVPLKLDQDLNDLEAYLRKTLTPISPRRDFVDGLHQKLAVESPGQPKAFSILQKTMFGLVVGLSGVFLLIVVVRIIVGFVHSMSSTRQEMAGSSDI